jgi:hypothetical protein
MNDLILELIAQLENEKGVTVEYDPPSLETSQESDELVSEDHLSDDDDDLDVLGAGNKGQDSGEN